jgi:membrane associated rhomboid family serine protease
MQELCQFVHYWLVYSHYEVVAVGGGMTIPMMQYLDQILTVGASGAVYGILLGYGMTFPDNQIFIIPFPFPIKAKWLVIGYVVLELGLGIRGSAADNVAHFAHLGGMLTGFLILLYWKHKERKDNHIKFTW